MSGKQELAVAEYEALVPGSDIAEALAANVDSGAIRLSDLPKVGMPAGGGKVWSWTDSGNNEVTSKEICGILVYFGKFGTLWPTVEPSGTGSQPLLVTRDWVTAKRVGDDLGDLKEEVLEKARIGDKTYSWPDLEYCQYGSRGRGKRCNEYRILGVLQKGEAWPVMIHASAGSISAIESFVSLLRVPYYRAEIGVSLVKEENSAGQPFSKVFCRYISALSREEGEIVKGMYTDPLTAAAAAELS